MSRLSRLCASALLCLVTLEICARVDDWASYDAPIFGPYDLESLFQQTERGWRGVPHGRYIHWTLNRDGFRGPELQADIGQTRVVTYGASETFGLYEEPGAEFPRVLERELNARSSHTRYEVINSGMPGMRVGSGLQLLEDIGRDLHPSYVIIYPTPTHYVGVTRPYCGRPPAARGEPRRLPTLRILERLKDRLKGALPPRGLTLMRRAVIAWQTRTDHVIEEVQPASLGALSTDLRCAIAAVRRIGAEPILVTHASRFSPRDPRPEDEYWLTGWRLQYPEIREPALLALEHRANMVIAAVARDEHVTLVDASGVLGGVPDNFADHAHFNDRGARRMGELLAGSILQVEQASSGKQTVGPLRSQSSERPVRVPQGPGA